MQARYEEILLVCLQGKYEDWRILYRTKEKAYEELKKLTGQDFGYDFRAWRKWLFCNNQDLAEFGTSYWIVRYRSMISKRP